MAAEKSQDFQKTVARLAHKAIGQDFSRALRHGPTNEGIQLWDQLPDAVWLQANHPTSLNVPNSQLLTYCGGYKGDLVDGVEVTGFNFH